MLTKTDLEQIAQEIAKIVRTQLDRALAELFVFMKETFITKEDIRKMVNHA